MPVTGGPVASLPGPVGRPPTPHGVAVPPRGLSRAEAEDRLARDGPNELPAPARVPAWRRLAAEMFHFFALLFWVAGILAFVAGMPQLGVAIFVVVVLNGLFSFVQEERAERAARRERGSRKVASLRRRAQGAPAPSPADLAPSLSASARRCGQGHPLVSPPLPAPTRLVSRAQCTMKWCAADPGPRFLHCSKATGVPHLRCNAVRKSACAAP